MNSGIDVNYEPLPGYRLIERIGAGGYGEVWRAEAPGGLTKAIKFVFGQYQERRALNELRALERVKDVRHPFLLSLERIEVIDGRLIVVTELASGSVKDRFEACRQLGLPGIPRDELLGYMRDAADALDFMSDQHSLQHLDIKPENLLLLAGHVKVADFGLVKDVRQLEVSLVGGMTPLYAAPELFQGAPTRCSDQYSLAIVYQDMLTGTLPFAGRNAAELTLQHLNDEPDLSSLTSADRYVVARALAKSPRHRYGTCREFVEALTKISREGCVPPSESWTETSAAPAQAAETTARPSSRTELFEEQCVEGEVGVEPRFTLPPTGSTITDLPPIDVQQQQYQPLPTLFLGVGGIAGRVLIQLRRKMVDRYGTAVVPAMPILWFDSDPAELAAASERTVGRLFVEETFAMPLCRPSHYRDQSQQLLQWLGRRWLYNIPRSLRTEGLRPLGRLALVDHARQTGQRIRRAVIDAVDPDAIRSSSQAVGRAFRGGDAQVYVLASISGGTGSGMAIDLGYLVRAVLDKLELPHAKVIGLMMHATGRDSNQSELARVNAYSWLTEFHHFQQPTNAYPNDGSCCMPGHEPQTPPFDYTYLVHLGDSLDTHELDYATESVADYLELDSLTAARSFFDACRRQDAGASASNASGRTASLRSFGMFREPAVAADLCDELAAAVSRRVVTGWRGPGDARPLDVTAGQTTTDPFEPTATHPSDAVAADGGHLVDRLHLEPAAISALAETLLEAELGTDAPTFVASWLASHDHRPAEQLGVIDQLFDGGEAAADGIGQSTLLGRPAAVVVQPLAEKLCSEVRRWVIQHVENPEQRLSGARRAAAWLRHYLDAADEHIQRLRRSATTQLLVLRNTAATTPPTPTPGRTAADDDHAIRYFHLRLHQLALLAARQMISLILSEVKTVADNLTVFGERLDQFQVALSESGDGRRGDTLATGPGAAQETRPDAVAAVPREKFSELSVSVDRRLRSEYLERHDGLYATVMRGGRDRARLCATMHQYARDAVESAWASVHAFDSLTGGAEPDNTLVAGLKSATPSLLQHGGTRRVLTVVPRDVVDKVGPADLARMIGTEVSMVAGLDNDLSLCVEADGLSLPHVAADIIQYRQDRKELADRVHSRTDIAWTPLVPTAPEPPDGPAVAPITQTEFIAHSDAQVQP